MSGKEHKPAGMRPEEPIEELLAFVLAKGLIAREDVVPGRNALLDLMEVSEPCPAPAEDIVPEMADDILEGLLDYCAGQGIIEDTVTARDLMDARIMGLLMPRASETAREFWRLYRESPKSATDYFYALSRDSNYIRVGRINKNLYWTTETEFGALEVTVNLSKPEKDPKEIAEARALPQGNYPQCPLCAENAGFAGHMDHPARQNLRLIPLELRGAEWYFQYSPYVYYNEHCIILNGEHIPMRVDRGAFERIFAFVETFPHYFLGSNAELPIVGGSILAHDHYQGGRHVFPMERAESWAGYSAERYPDIEVKLVKWPLSVIRLTGAADKAGNADIIELAGHILDAWQGYSDEDAGILSHTGDIPHNAVTPIVRVNRQGRYEMDIVLRNNRTSTEHPMGIFHPHENLHHIKKENIGLIEVMGLAVLPGRLEDELAEIRGILTDSRWYAPGELEEDLRKHEPWIARMLERYGNHNIPESADSLLRDEVGNMFADVLRDAGVFKWSEAGRGQFAGFMEVCGFRRGDG